MPLERWIQAAHTDHKVYSDHDSTDNEFEPLLGDDGQAEAGDEELDERMQDLEEEHDTLCNEMQRILFDAMLTERLSTTNSADIESDEVVSGHSDDNDLNGYTVSDSGQDEDATLLTGVTYEAWEVYIQLITACLQF